ncbi:MAG: SufS family cysteine desulfurase [bacterium]
MNSHSPAGSGVSTKYDVARIREDFPALRRTVKGQSLVYFDNTAATLKPQTVIDTITRVYSDFPANVHRGIHQLSEEATEAYEAARLKAANFINAGDPDEIVVTLNTTDSLNHVCGSWGEANIGPGDEILTTEMEHHANFVPWQQLCLRKGAKFQVARVLPSGQLDREDFDRKLSERTKLVAVAHVSNVSGVVNPISELAAQAHRVGAVFVADCAQSVPHMPVDVQALGADFVSCSAYKFLAPFGVGLLWGRKAILDAMPPYRTGGNMIHSVSTEKTRFNVAPHKFEAGTPSIADVIGMGAAIDYLQAIGMQAISDYEHELSRYMHEELLKLPGLSIAGDWFPGKPAIASFHLDYAHPHDIAQFLNEEGVAVRSGLHCAEPLHCSLGLSSTTRASLYLYNTHDEIDRLVAAIRTVEEIFA